MPRNAQHKFGYEWRTKNRRPQKRASVEVTDHMYGTPAEAFARIAAAIEEAGLVEAELGTDMHYGSYGDRDRDIVIARGWRDATTEEIAKAEDALTQARERSAQHEAQRVAEAEALLRETRPELFQD